ncbi:MAG: hypothetical protein ACRD8U_22555, partial [Pyrinomonadaceae bacterium]
MKAARKKTATKAASLTQEYRLDNLARPNKFTCAVAAARTTADPEAFQNSSLSGFPQIPTTS